MDLNELLHAHQVAVMQASASGDEHGRDNHYAKVAEYAERVRQLRKMKQMADGPKPIPARAGAPETIIYGTYAGDAAVPAKARPVEAWEDEGGALNPPQVILPDGVTSKTVRHYHVGPYVYQDLDLAMAEHLRQLSAEPGDD